ncbi:MAG: stage V sporulation protein AC [Clostridia bacterium]|nr:stage V sporulation protein AC [Clostridia bacterium]
MAKADERERRRYLELRSRVAPRHPRLRNAARAFAVGGLICAAGEGVMTYFMRLGLSADQAALPTAALLVLFGSVLTGLGVYDRWVRYAGMGASLPITGFANAIVAPAMEFRREGWVMGVGARMFEVAGPVIVFGTLASVVVGLGWYLLAGPAR